MIYEAISTFSNLFGGLALVLACVGLYGVTSFTVARRTHEIGIRLALGAGPGRLLWRCLAGALRLAAAGVLAGVPLTLVAARLLETLLFGVQPHDPATILLAAAGLVMVAAAAGFLPARRASRVDPVVALRHEP